MGFGFLLIVEQIVEALIRSIVGGAEVEDPACVSRSWSRRLVPWSALRDRRRDLGGGLGERPAAHSAEAVIFGIFIAAMGAAHDICFLPSKPMRSVGPQRPLRGWRDSVTYMVASRLVRGILIGASSRWLSSAQDKYSGFARFPSWGLNGSAGGRTFLIHHTFLRLSRPHTASPPATTRHAAGYNVCGCGLHSRGGDRRPTALHVCR